jgi:hypothetical protein
VDRRSFLGLGAALGLAALPRTLLAAPRRRKARGVVWLWMGGGMSPFLTWDPKPGAKGMPSLKAIDTVVAGVRFSELLPVCASQMAHLNVIRSLSHDEVHEEGATGIMHGGTGLAHRFDDLPPIGTILSHELGNPEHPLPGHLSMDGPPLTESEALGAEHLPVRLDGAIQPLPYLRRSVDAERDRGRSGLLAEQNADWTASRRQPGTERLLAASRAAERIMNTPLLKAFHTADEPEALRAEYGPGFGERCLVARRLVEAGCPFVEIGLPGWMPGPWLPPSLRGLVTGLDRGFGTLVKDLAAKRLLDGVLVVCATPFGHPPPAEGPPLGAGWSRGFSVVLAGGMLAGGAVHGDTGPDGRDCKDPVTPGEFLATVLSACGLDWEKTYEDPPGRKRRYVQRGQPVQDLF